MICNLLKNFYSKLSSLVLFLFLSPTSLLYIVLQDPLFTSSLFSHVFSPFQCFLGLSRSLVTRVLHSQLPRFFMNKFNFHNQCGTSFRSEEMYRFIMCFDFLLFFFSSSLKYLINSETDSFHLYSRLLKCQYLFGAQRKCSLD